MASANTIEAAAADAKRGRYSDRGTNTNYKKGVPPIHDLYPCFTDEGKAVTHMIDKGLIDLDCCPKCGSPLHSWKVQWDVHDTKILKKDNLKMGCTGKPRHYFSPFANTFFGHMKVPKNEILFLLYLWSVGVTNQQAEILSGCTNRVVGQIYKFINEACQAYVLSDCENMMVGGPCIIVEIDESK